MIEKFHLDAWRQIAPWLTLAQVEQDLVISRALVELYSHPKVSASLVFRGGTALNKLFLPAAARYSEDIDLVQHKSEPIGETLSVIRSVLDNWLGTPKRKLTERSAKLIYRYQSTANLPAKLKIEINTTEHYHIFDHIKKPFNVNSDWFNGKTIVTTYHLDELMGSKLRALYQRRKGRDLFDIWLMLHNDMIDVKRVIEVFLGHSQELNQVITRAMFEESLLEKSEQEDFRNEVVNLITPETKWSFEEAMHRVMNEIVPHLPGESWRNKNQ